MRSLISVGLIAVALPVAADVVPLEFGTTVNTATITAIFNIFAPDFYTTASQGGQADRFQLYVASNAPAPVNYFSNASIKLGSGPPFIWLNPNDPDSPKKGGSGSIQGYVNFVPTGRPVAFDIPLGLLQENNGSFWFLFATHHYGVTTYSGDGATIFLSGQQYTPTAPPVAVPLPAAYLMFLSGLGLLGILARKSCIKARHWSAPAT